MLHAIDIAPLTHKDDCLAKPFARWLCWMLMRGPSDNLFFTLSNQFVSKQLVAALLELTDEFLIDRCIQIILQSRSKEASPLSLEWQESESCYQIFGCDCAVNEPFHAPGVLLISSAAPIICPELPSRDYRKRAAVFERAIKSVNLVVAATTRCIEDLRLYAGRPESDPLPLLRDEFRAERAAPPPPTTHATIVCSSSLAGKLNLAAMLPSEREKTDFDLTIFDPHEKISLEGCDRCGVDDASIDLRGDWSPRELDEAFKKSAVILLLSYYDELDFLSLHASAYDAKVLSVSVEVDVNAPGSATFTSLAEPGVIVSEWLIDSLAKSQVREAAVERPQGPAQRFSRQWVSLIEARMASRHDL